jgi:two-component system alkaline phosphatase synthesis response regulator PhoP
MMQRPTRVLIIEDQAKIVHWLSAFLQQANFEVLAAYDGKTGLHLARTESPDVIILDLMLPDMDGLMCVRPSASAPTPSSSCSPPAWTMRRK